MARAWFDQEDMKRRLSVFFEDERPSVTVFGNTVNQTFEAFVFAALIAWYRKKRWDIKFVHPKHAGYRLNRLMLKYYSVGRPENYSYVVCRKNGQTAQIHHQLRVATYYHQSDAEWPANIVLDVAVIRETNVIGLSSSDAISNKAILTFGEAKHMSGFAELVASFIGMAHEMIPDRVRARRKAESAGEHLFPFLYVSGSLNRTAKGILETIRRRNLSVGVFCDTKDLTAAFKLSDSHFGRATRRPPTGKTKAKVAAESKVLSKDIPF